LTNFNEAELKVELENYKFFDRLNNKKITPHFMRMTRTLNSTPELDKICDDNSNEFITSEAREQYITEFYKNLYKKPADDLIANQNEIENFLGDVVNHELVTGSKLSEAEKNSIDAPLTINEFDLAIRSSNKKSAPRTDGLSNVFINKFWQYFRVPLLKYTNCCMEKGLLTSQFKIAKIRIIPKKGDHKKIGNWRPISLLNCFYKLISRVLSNRIKKIIDKVTHVGQYGYSNSKQCQEVLMGLLNEANIAKKRITGG
jgi:Reverse transcriptase (RNA-dependent DNA polymerase)